MRKCWFLSVGSVGSNFWAMRHPKHPDCQCLTEWYGTSFTSATHISATLRSPFIITQDRNPSQTCPRLLTQKGHTEAPQAERNTAASTPIQEELWPGDPTDPRSRCVTNISLSLRGVGIFQEGLQSSWYLKHMLENCTITDIIKGVGAKTWMVPWIQRA